MALIKKTEHDIIVELLWVVLERIAECDIGDNSGIRSILHQELADILSRAVVAGCDPVQLYEEVIAWQEGRADL